MSPTHKLIVLAACLILGTAGGVTLAAFSGQTSNTGNSFSAAATFPGDLRMASGTYDGNGSDNRSITGLGFQPDVVIIKGNVAQVAALRTSTMTGDATKPLVGATGLSTNRIQAIQADGFQVGTDSSVNGSGTTFYWTAFKGAAGTLKVGTYSGNGSSQSITGVGFSPEYLMIASVSTDRAVQWFNGATNTYLFDADAGVSTGVTATGSDGFTLGSNTNVNTSARTYHYVAFNDVAGSVDAGTYTGNGTSKSVTGVGFGPEYVIVRGSANVTGQHRNVAVSGSGSLNFSASANITTGITALQSDGFQVGNNSSVNTNATTYQYVAFENSAGGCSQPSQATLTAANDSWVNQASPSGNNGSDSVLKVTSKSGNANTRAYVDFNLPTLPAGCTVTGATLSAYNKSPISGRTLTAHRAAAAWGESSITWSNQPATAGTAATATTPGSAGWMNWSVTALANDLYSSGNYGFRIADQTEGSASSPEQQFHSTEDGTNPPALVLSIGS